MALLLGIRSRSLSMIIRGHDGKILLSRSMLTSRFVVGRRGRDQLKSFSRKNYYIRLGMTFLGGVYCLSTFNHADCAEKYPNNDSADNKGDNPRDPISILIATYSPMLNKLGLSGAVGICAGYASKRIGKEFAFVVGCGFLVLQYLNDKGYISIKYDKAKQDIIQAVDTDGDGQFTAKDILFYWKKIKHIMINQLPASSGFLTGFAIGIMYM
eukprot:gene11071-23136_t